MAFNRHSMAQVEGACALFVAGSSDSSGTSSNLSAPLATQADIVTAKSSTGVYTITVNPFKGPLGNVVCVASPVTTARTVQVVSKTYTNESLVVTINTFSDVGSTAADSAFEFILWAF